MLVSKKRLYTELNKVIDLTHDIISVIEMEKDKRRYNDQDLAERINYILEKVLDLTDRVEALEAKKQTKKATKKAKAKKK